MGKFDIAPVRAEIVMQDGHQTVRLPDAFRVEGSEITIRREGDKVILEPVIKDRFASAEARKAFWAAIDNACDEPFPERIVDQEPLREIDLDA